MIYGILTQNLNTTPQDSKVSLIWSTDTENIIRKIDNDNIISIRGLLDESFVEFAKKIKPRNVVIASDKIHQLEYSFGVDVLKYKSQLKHFVEIMAANNVKCSVETDYRHENILHAQDCGFEMVEFDVDKYSDENYDYYVDVLEIASEREFKIGVFGRDVERFLKIFKDCKISQALKKI